MTREEAIKILSNRDGHGIPSGYNSGYAEAIEVAIETLKAEPRKHGRWIWRGGNLYECSECGAIVVAQDYIPIELHYFCRGCGADMREAEE